MAVPLLRFTLEQNWYNAFNVYRRELASGTVSLTGDRAQGDDSKHWAYSNTITYKIQNCFPLNYCKYFYILDIYNKMLI